MAYSKVSPQPAMRDPSSTDIAAPGLYPNEVAVQLDTGQLVAVFVERTWTPNNAGLEFYTSARLINADGSTKLCNAGSEVVTEFRHSSTSEELAAHGADALATQHAMASLGEPIATVPVPGSTTGETMPMIPWDAIFLANVSIRTAISSVAYGGEVKGLAALI